MPMFGRCLKILLWYFVINLFVLKKTEKKILSGENKKELNNKLNKFKTKIPDFHNKFNEQYNRLPTKEELKTIVTNAINERELKTVNKKKKNFDRFNFKKDDDDHFPPPPSSSSNAYQK